MYFKTEQGVMQGVISMPLNFVYAVSIIQW